MPPKISIAALAALENAGINPQTSQIVGGSSGGFPSTSTFNTPQELYSLDQILINGVILPLAEMPKTHLELDLDAKKTPGTDWKTYVSKGMEQKPIEIKILLFRDAWTRKDWFAEWARISSLIPAKKIELRSGVSVYHPVLVEMGITSLLFTERSSITREKGQIFSVSLKGLDPKRIRYNGGASKKATPAPPLGSKNANGKFTAAGEQFPETKPPGENLGKSTTYPGQLILVKKEPLNSTPIGSVPPANTPLQSRLPSLYRK